MSGWQHQVEVYLRQERNEQFRRQVEQLKRDGCAEQLKRLFGQRLTFGTAGIRGPMGPGWSQMNDLVIIQTTQGLASYLLETYGESLCARRGVIIGHDARHNSSRFARLAALVFLQRHIRVYFCQKIVPTPLVAFGVTHFNCHCGLVITASHNPKQDNGYKVYWSNGAQILTPHDVNIQRHIERDQNQSVWSAEWSYAHEEVLGEGGAGGRLPAKMRDQLHCVYDQLTQAYFDYLQRLVSGEQRALNAATPLTITFTSMHGVGHEFMARALRIGAFQRAHPVAEQMKPDPDFPTVSFPNPEEAGALELAFETAARTRSQLILANDPDADRCAAALFCAASQRRRLLTGNEIGQLLGWWLWHLHQTRTSTSAAAATAHSHDSHAPGSSASAAPANDAQQTLSANFHNDDDDQELDLDFTADKTPATPITKPILGTGCVQVLSGNRKSTSAHSACPQARPASGLAAAARSPSPSASGRPARREDCFMLSTAVSSRFLETMARHEGFQFVETLTGFKYMGNKAHELLRRNKSPLFAYEEAIGYMCDAQILDKDGISAALQLAQCAAYLMHTHQRTLEAQLDWLHLKYGYHFSLNSYYLCDDARIIRNIFHKLQSNYPRSFASRAPDQLEEFPITRLRDLNNGIDNGTPDHKPDLPTSSNSFMVTFWVGQEIRFTIRTSGTEPKIKYYSEIVTPLTASSSAFDSELESEWRAQMEREKRAARQRLQRFLKAALERCLEPDFYKLQHAAS